MPLVNFTNLDFDQIKTTLRDYLKANSNFTDYDNGSFDVTIIYEIIGADVPAQQLQFVLQPTR